MLKFDLFLYSYGIVRWEGETRTWWGEGRVMESKWNWRCRQRCLLKRPLVTSQIYLRTRMAMCVCVLGYVCSDSIILPGSGLFKWLSPLKRLIPCAARDSSILPLQRIRNTDTSWLISNTDGCVCDVKYGKVNNFCSIRRIPPSLSPVCPTFVSLLFSIL